MSKKIKEKQYKPRYKYAQDLLVVYTNLLGVDWETSSCDLYFSLSTPHS